MCAVSLDIIRYPLHWKSLYQRRTDRDIKQRGERLGREDEGIMAGGPTRIVSGGQSGVDRAALDFAAGHGLDFGGWCPLGGFAEDYPHPPGVRLGAQDPLKRDAEIWRSAQPERSC